MSIKHRNILILSFNNISLVIVYKLQVLSCQNLNLWLSSQCKEQGASDETGHGLVSSSEIKCTSNGDEFESTFYLLSWWFIQCVFLFYPFFHKGNRPVELNRPSLVWCRKEGWHFFPFLMLMKRGAFPALACRACLSCSMLHCLDIVRAQKSRPGIQ